MTPEELGPCAVIVPVPATESVADAWTYAKTRAIEALTLSIGDLDAAAWDTEAPALQLFDEGRITDDEGNVLITLGPDAMALRAEFALR